MEAEQRSEERDVPNHNIIEIVRKRRDDLRKSDRKVADLVLADPKRVLTATVAGYNLVSRFLEALKVDHE